MNASRELELTVRRMNREQLDALVSGYNWDDGLELMWRVVEHPACDLGTAIRVFWLASPFGLWDSDEPKDPRLDYLATLLDRISRCDFATRLIRVDPLSEGYIPNRVWVRKLRQMGVPHVVLDGTPE